MCVTWSKIGSHYGCDSKDLLKNKAEKKWIHRAIWNREKSAKRKKLQIQPWFTAIWCEAQTNDCFAGCLWFVLFFASSLNL